MWTMAFNKGSVFNYRELTACVVDRSTHHTPFEHLDILLLHLWFPKWRGWWRAHLPMQEMQETWVRSRGWEDSLEEDMATCSGILAWETPETEEPGRLQSMGRREQDTTDTHTSSVFGLDLSARELVCTPGVLIQEGNQAIWAWHHPSSLCRHCCRTVSWLLSQKQVLPVVAEDLKKTTHGWIRWPV